VNAWDGGYSSGGNYWSEYDGSDLYSGPYQNETGYDWIGDSPYIIGQNNIDRYPLMNPFVPETEETRIAYRNLLLKYDELQEQICSLNSTYNALKTSIDSLQHQVDLLNLTLQISIDELQSQIDSMNSTLISEQKAIVNELANIGNLVYVSIATTVILIATIVYFAKIRPKKEP
jgi:hypothetical protein